VQKSKRPLAGLAVAVALAAGLVSVDAQLPAPPVGPPPPPPPRPDAAAGLAQYQPVTADRLRNPEPANWLMIRRTYDGWGYSPLDQITTENVSRLQLQWTIRTGEVLAHQSAPIVNNGVMFITTPYNQVMAINAASGVVLWRYRKPRPAGSIVRHQPNRGVALYQDKVFFTAGEAVLIALDAKTGRELWQTEVANNKAAYYTTLAPLVADGKVMIGTSGGETGVRGFVAAFDPDTGRELWRTFTIPAPGEPGSETWPKGEQWRTGGAPVWVTGNYDPSTNTSYWGTGNGGPWTGDTRPGDNLYVASTVAINVATGRITGHFQYSPNESWDWDEVSPPILVDFQRNGRTVKGLVNVARNGYLWFLERTAAGPITFVEGKPYVNQNVFTRLDPVTGRPEIDPARKPGIDKTAEFCPNAHGGKNWPPIAFNPQTRMIYVPANNNICGRMTGVPVTYTAGQGFTGIRQSPAFLYPGADHIGEVQAWHVDTGERVWTHRYRRSPNWGSMLTTAGGLVFSGGTVDRNIHAFDAASGKLLWEFTTNSGIIAPPTTFTVDGKQYLAVESGWDGDARGMANNVARFFPGEVPAVPQGGAVWVFALE
jgi:alcohol dehydrogenase (cytochrome c)